MIHDNRNSRMRKLYSWSRTAFSLVELLIVVSIIGVLVGLLLPAIQAARETARRSRCSNNLRQIGIAIHSYHGQHRKFPPGAHLHRVELRTSISWRVMILPFLEETAVYDQIRPDSDGGAGIGNAQLLPIDVYLCPSAPPVPVSSVDLQPSQYSGVSGVGRSNHRISLPPDGCGDIDTDGVFFPGSRTTIAKIEDGTSHTLAIGERTYIFRDWMWGAVWLDSPPSMICTGASNNIRYPINANPTQFGYYTRDPGAPPNLPIMLLNDLYFGSYHPNGAQFCFADGSVNMLADTIGFTVFEDMATIAGGEVHRWNP